MAFWSSERLKQRLQADGLITPYDEAAVNHCAYELAMGSQATVTMQAATRGKDRKIMLGAREPLVIPPGQFGLLLTKEIVTIPKDAIGFISIRAGKKFEGLVNVSGFHVDPGFSGRLKFSVYNAGSNDIVVSEADRIFMVWFADLDQPTADGYGQVKPEQNEISTQDLTRMQGEVASPSQLRRDITDLQHSLTNLKWMLAVLITFSVALFVRILTEKSSSPSAPINVMQSAPPAPINVMQSPALPASDTAPVRSQPIPTARDGAAAIVGPASPARTTSSPVVPATTRSTKR